jgi:hypothetical protein
MSNMFGRALRAAALAVAVTALAGTAQAQQPTPAAIALAKEVLILKEASRMWDPVIPGVIDRVRQTLLQSNLFAQGDATWSKDLNEIATQLVKESASKTAELSDLVARVYAERFTEAELKEVLAFFKTPAGRKVIVEEPKVIDASAGLIQQWADKFSEAMISRMRVEMKKKGHEL